MKLFSKFTDDEFVSRVRRYYSRRRIFGVVISMIGLISVVTTIYLWFKISAANGAIANPGDDFDHLDFIENVHFLVGAMTGVVFGLSMTGTATALPIGLHMIFGSDRITELLLSHYKCGNESENE